MSRSAALMAGTACALMAGRPAAAWDAETHLALARMALTICPAAASRVPLSQYREAAAQAAQEPDPFDPKCKYHTGGPGSKDSAAAAEQLLKQLISGKGLERPLARAQALGRLVHYVADTAVPASMIGEQKPMPPGIWSDTDYVIFREPTGLTQPLAAGLRKASEAARWGDDSSSANVTAFRVAANLIADTLLMLPPVEGEPGPDAGPVFIGIDRNETQMAFPVPSAPAATAKKGAEQTAPADRFQNTQNLKVYLPDRPGVQVAEWNEKITEGAPTATVRALLLNNGDTCVDDVTIETEGWSATVHAKLAPRAVKVVELQARPRLALAKLTAKAKSHACSGPFAPDMGFIAKDRRVIPVTGHPPNSQDAVIR